MNKWVTFDCFGTLIDWATGFQHIVAPMAGCRTSGVLSAYHRHERSLETEKPFIKYRDVLSTALMRAAGDAGMPISLEQAAVLPASWAQLPKFPDVEPMLARLRQTGCRLAVLTNCDDDLFVETERSFAQPFDLVITAEQVLDYKPSLAHFDRFRQIALPEHWVHVANSWFHDVEPARRMRVPCVWLDRDSTGDDPTRASVRVTCAPDVPGAVLQLEAGSR